MMRDTDDLLTHVFKYYKASGNRTGSLERIQKMLEDGGQKKVKQAAHTRWLSHLDAVTSLRDTYQAVIMDLENAVESGNDNVRLGSGPSASGLAKKLKSYESVHIVHFLCDALKPVTNLALVFEKNDIDLSIIKPRKEATISALNRLKTVDGISMKRAETLLMENNIMPSENQKRLVKEAEQQFVDNLIEEIENRLASSDLIDCMSVFNMEEVTTFYGNDEIMHLADHFRLCGDQTLMEWESLKDAVSSVEQETVKGPTKLMQLLTKLKLSTGQCFGNIEKLCATAAVIPVSTAEVERVFSEVNRTKTDIRNRLDVDTVHQLLTIHRNDKYLDFGKTVNRWHGQKNRRI
jgi:hypothetical protein